MQRASRSVGARRALHWRQHTDATLPGRCLGSTQMPQLLQTLLYPVHHCTRAVHSLMRSKVLACCCKLAAPPSSWCIVVQ